MDLVSIIIFICSSKILSYLLTTYLILCSGNKNSFQEGCMRNLIIKENVLVVHPILINFRIYAMVHIVNLLYDSEGPFNCLVSEGRYSNQANSFGFPCLKTSCFSDGESDTNQLAWPYVYVPNIVTLPSSTTNFILCLDLPAIAQEFSIVSDLASVLPKVRGFTTEYWPHLACSVFWKDSNNKLKSSLFCSWQVCLW